MSLKCGWQLRWCKMLALTYLLSANDSLQPTSVQVDDDVDNVIDSFIYAVGCKYPLLLYSISLFQGVMEIAWFVCVLVSIVDYNFV